ncbi:MAG: hypothetical protein F4Y03_04440 [Alphaproteobacteria bacterium]|nr:hypothetical protein [Alphaproteobacteria bacterium]
MTLLYPWFFWASCGAAAGAVALHVISWELREPVPFPTLRFVPEREVIAAELNYRLSDLKLLLLRLAIVLLLGLALAQPFWVAPDSEARVVLVDVSAAVARDDAWRERVGEVVAGTDSLIAYADAPSRIEADGLDGAFAAESAAPPAPVGNLSAALAAAIQEDETLKNRAETVSLTILSPFPLASFDAATNRLRALWQGPLETMRVPPAEPAAMAETLGATSVALHWDGSAGSSRESPWQLKDAPDRAEGILTPVATLVAPFERKWQLADADASDLRVVATWLDGAPAAVERIEDGVRHTFLGFALSDRDDIALRPSFVRYRDWLEDPARLLPGMNPVDDLELARLLQPVTEAASEPSAQETRIQITRAAPWVLLLALVLALAEPALRRVLADRRDLIGDSA